jgi:phosphatidylglycerophosphate synthase
MAGKTDGKAEHLFTLPNMLSFSRLITSPLVLWFFSLESPAGQIATLAFLALSFSTDFFDGVAARKLNM